MKGAVSIGFDAAPLLFLLMTSPSEKLIPALVGVVVCCK